MTDLPTARLAAEAIADQQKWSFKQVPPLHILLEDVLEGALRFGKVFGALRVSIGQQ